MPRISKTREARRREMLEAAVEQFRARGYEQTTVRDIVQSVGVAQGLFYYYFRSKEDALFAALSESGEQLLARIAAIIASSGAPPIPRLREAFAAIADFLRHGYDSLRLPSIGAKLFALFERQTRATLLPYLTELLEEGTRGGDFALQYPEYTARFILAGFVGVCLEPAMPAAEEIMALLQQYVERILSLPSGALAPMEGARDG